MFSCIRCMAKWMVRRPDWGVIFYAYDLFAAFRTDMVSKVTRHSSATLHHFQEERQSLCCHLRCHTCEGGLYAVVLLLNDLQAAQVGIALVLTE